MQRKYIKKGIHGVDCSPIKGIYDPFVAFFIEYICLLFSNDVVIRIDFSISSIILL
jgi:hypothetical protein